MSYVRNLNTLENGFPKAQGLVGRAISLEYASGHTLEQHWQTEDRILWKGTAGPLAGYSQIESYMAFEVSSGLVLITWVEESTAVTADGAQQPGPWLTDVLVDFNTLRAMASWTGPTEDGGSEHVLDQAAIREISCDLS